MFSEFTYRHLRNQHFTTLKFISLLLLLSLLIASPGGTSPAYASGRCYVKKNASGSNDGSSWANAYTDLQSALPNHSCTEVWVAAGTYYPTNTFDRTISFVLRAFALHPFVPAIDVFGGFAGTETLLSQRNPSTHVTILSGDIGVHGLASDNSYHVVTGGGVKIPDVLDGFTITAGNADGVNPSDNGGGFYTKSNPTLTNLIFTGNSAKYGGGIFIDSSKPNLTDVTFNDNSADLAGGGMYNNYSYPTLKNITFTGNSSGEGGGMSNNNANPTMTNLTFIGNRGGFGGGMINLQSAVSLTNVTFTGNSATNGGGGIYNGASSSLLANDSIFWNDGSEMFSKLSTITISDSLIAGGCPSIATCTGTILTTNPLLSPLANNGGYTMTMALRAGSPAIDAGNNSTCASTDQRGVHRPQGPHCDMGAYEARYLAFRSSGSQDGWVLESAEHTSVGGGSPNSSGPTLTLGDNLSRKQYRAVLSFNTSSLPDNATITSVLLKFKRSSVTPPSTNPITLLHGIMLDLKKGFFGSSSALQVSDFQASASKTVGPYSPALSSGFYSINLPASTFTSINKLNTNGGLTQVRLRFKLDDNNNSIANTLNLISGNNATPVNRPTLIIVYTTP